MHKVESLKPPELDRRRRRDLPRLIKVFEPWMPGAFYEHLDSGWSHAIFPSKHGICQRAWYEVILKNKKMRQLLDEAIAAKRNARKK